jgi:hypothetical protein
MDVPSLGFEGGWGKITYRFRLEDLNAYLNRRTVKNEAGRCSINPTNEPREEKILSRPPGR